MCLLALSGTPNPAVNITAVCLTNYINDKNPNEKHLTIDVFVLNKVMILFCYYCNYRYKYDL